nr:helix-turn-helix domain-containing protein [Mediterraneibacter glycyrrhizinilyticus]
MNDTEFIEALKTKRNACAYSQSRLARELHISRQNLNEIENGKTGADREMKHMLLHYLDFCQCTQPFTLNIDYLHVRFPATDALEIKNVLAMKSEYFIHEGYTLERKDISSFRFFVAFYPVC